MLADSAACSCVSVLTDNMCTACLCLLLHPTRGIVLQRVHTQQQQ